MPTFDDFDAYAGDDDYLDLPIHGKTYRIHPMGIRDGALIERYRSGDTKALESFDEEAVLRMTLGPAYDEMLADNVSRAAVGRAHMTAMAYHEGGVEMARRVWDRSIDPELGAALGAAMQQQETANRATRRASTRSKSTAAAARTRTPASTSGTSSPKATKRAAARKPGSAT